MWCHVTRSSCPRAHSQDEWAAPTSTVADGKTPARQLPDTPRIYHSNNTAS